jgi:hypothetical protein
MRTCYFSTSNTGENYNTMAGTESEYFGTDIKVDILIF